MKPERHVALLVEDDPEMAAETIELLRSFDHECVHASTKVEAERLVEAGEFCYALLDLEIKVDADSIRARVEAGEGVLELIRRTYPNRNDDDAHLLQVLMVSGHSDLRHVVRAFHQRADDFIAKPIGDSNPPLKAKIEEALRRSGRLRHADCPALTRRAKRLDDQTSPPGTEPRLAIVGAQRGTRYEVRFGNEQMFVRLTSLVILVKLFAARLRNADAWVHKADLGAKDDQGWKAMTRLKEDLEALPADVELIENDSRGGYRLHPTIATGAIDMQRLSSIENAQIRSALEEIAALRPR